MDVERNEALLGNPEPRAVESQRRSTLKGVAMGLVVGLGVACVVALAAGSFTNSGVAPNHEQVAARFSRSDALRLHEKDFIDYMKTHNKRYANAEEYEFRFNVFVQSINFIEGHRAASGPNPSYQVGINHFSDMTFEEFKQARLGLNIHGLEDVKNIETIDFGLQAELNSEGVDWRSKGCVTPAKDQMHCGSCWSFSTTGLVEGAKCMRDGELVSLSEQQLVDCDTPNDNGCHGGLPARALNYVQEHGLMKESDYKYHCATEDDCANDECDYDKSKVVTSVKKFGQVRQGDEDALKQALEKLGPVSIAIDAENSLKHYTSGMYKGGDCSSEAQHMNHAVLLVGWGTENGEDYFIMKNSWGKWGDNGFAKMKIGSNLCGVANMAVVITDM